jgi:transposase
VIVAQRNSRVAQKVDEPLPQVLHVRCGLGDAALGQLRRQNVLDWPLVHLELKKKHVTKASVWQEYREQHPEGYGYSHFCEHYARWAGELHVTMRQRHRAGEKLFVDFSGDGLTVLDPKTGECRVAKLFVAVLGASNYTYIEAVYSEDLPNWIGCHVRALEYFGVVPEIVVPDNLKSGVKSPDYYDPVVNRTYADWAEHYGVAVIPARVRRPRDKAKVEQGVLLAERWILAALRHATFEGLGEFGLARWSPMRCNRSTWRPTARSLNHDSTWYFTGATSGAWALRATWRRAP